MSNRATRHEQIRLAAKTVASWPVGLQRAKKDSPEPAPTSRKPPAISQGKESESEKRKRVHRELHELGERVPSPPKDIGEA